MEREQEHIVYLGLGSNIGERRTYLSQAVSAIGRQVGRVLQQSSVIETAPVDFESEHAFLNQVICVASNLSMDDLLTTTQMIETSLGRTQKSIDGRHFDRTCDIDILLYDDAEVNSPELQIPHPRMLERSFVMLPLLEIAPELVIPGTGRTVKELVWVD